MDRHLGENGENGPDNSNAKRNVEPRLGAGGGPRGTLIIAAGLHAVGLRSVNDGGNSEQATATNE